MTDETPGMEIPPDEAWVGWHYHLCAFIGKGRIDSDPASVPATFDAIFRARPNDCRFAVAQMTPLVMDGAGGVTFTGERRGPFIVWDLLDEHLIRGRRTTPHGMATPPPPFFTAMSEDAAVMRAVIQYDKDG